MSRFYGQASVRFKKNKYASSFSWPRHIRPVNDTIIFVFEQKLKERRKNEAEEEEK